jgi:hypothetical protein
MFNLSLEAANDLFGWSNAALIMGAALVFFGTLGAIWAGKERDRYSDERIAVNEAKTAQANADALAAQTRAKELEVRLESERIERLKIERQIHPRSLSEEQRAILTAGIRAAGWKHAEIIWHGVGEPEIYARDLARAFDEAGAKVFVHTLGPFIPEAWGLSVIETSNGDSKRLQAFLDSAGVKSSLVQTNDTIGVKDHPTLFVGTCEDVGTPIKPP